MTDMNLNELTVLELRKVAKEMKVPLSAGISKQGIIDRLSLAIAEQNAETPAAPAVDVPAVEESAEPQTPDAEEDAAAEEDKPAEPQFKQAYVAPQRFSNRPSYQAPAYGRPAAPRTPAPADPQRTPASRPAAFQSRFGPAAQAPSVPQQDSYHDDDRARGAYSAPRSNYADNGRFQARPQPEQPRQAYEPRP